MLDKILRRVRDYSPHLLEPEGRMPEAAVLMPITRSDSPELVLTLRASGLSTHGGEVAFPGGRRDPEDRDLIHTALREAEEEVGLIAADVEVLGHINHHHTISEFQVRPYVATMSWPYELKPDGVEVARIFTIPLQWLADESNYRIEHRQHPESQRPWPVVYYDRYDGELLWGATARMTLSLIDILRG